MSAGPAALLKRWLAVFFLFAGGDALAKPPTPPALPPVDPARAQLILIRSNAHFGGWITVKVLVDRQEVMRLGNCRYAIIPVEPGDHLIEVVMGENGVGYKLAAEAGTQSFLRYATKLSDNHLLAEEYEVTWFVEGVTHDAALPLMAECKRQPLPSKKKKK